MKARTDEKKAQTLAPSNSVPSLQRLAVGQPVWGGFIDWVEVEPAGIVRILGWLKTPFDVSRIPAISLDGQTVPFLHLFRYPRPDVPTGSDTPVWQAGLALEYLVPELIVGNGASELVVRLEQNRTFTFKLASGFIRTHYGELFITDKVMHRDTMYNSGPPNVTIHPELLELVDQLQGPVLDYGCGRGLLVEHLRTRGLEAQGLELDSGMIRESLSSERVRFVTLYDGSLPSPFADGSFKSVVCSEVLEHIPEYQSAIKDIARLATATAIVTVPNMTSVPLGFRHGVVPWHLLERTHVNFFTQKSLEIALKPYFSTIEFGRIGAAWLGDSPTYVSLVAVCTK